jgi:2,3-bisphosphoglycerate-dependent phosphoglycerate mutase
VIGHVATYFGLEHYLNGANVDDLVAHDFVWQAGWVYRLD